MESSLICQLCGTAEWEWEENRFAYAPHSHFCKGCYIKETASEDGGKMPGTTITLVPNTEDLQLEEIRTYRRRAKMDLNDQPAMSNEKD